MSDPKELVARIKAVLAEYERLGVLGGGVVVDRDDLVALVDALLSCQAQKEEAERELRRIASAGSVKTGVSRYENTATGDPRLEAIADIARAALSGTGDEE